MTADIRSRAERLARLLEEQAEIAAQIAEVKAEAKSDGYDPALLMKTARLLAMDAEKRRKQLDQHELFDTYLSAVGLVAERVEPAGSLPPSDDPQVEITIGYRLGETPMPPQHTIGQEALLHGQPPAVGDRNQGDAARPAIAPEPRQAGGASPGGLHTAGSSTSEAPQAATHSRDEYPEMPAFLRRTRPVALEITA